VSTDVGEDDPVEELEEDYEEMGATVDVPDEAEQGEKGEQSE